MTAIGTFSHDQRHLPNGPAIPDAGGNSQLDTDNDGYGNICDPEYGDPDNVVGIGDFNVFRASWLNPSLTPPDRF